LNATLNFALAAAALIVPHFFSKYSKIWESRLKEKDKTEKLLDQQLGAY
jgi:hypothetical protein